VTRLHAVVAAHARLPAFFLPPYGAADTFEGRFEVLTLIAGLLLTRLNAAPAPGPAIAQELADAIFSAFDDALREVGVSDVGVPKKMKKLARAFMGRGGAYAEAAAQVDAGQVDAALTDALSRNVLSGGDAAAFAAYYRRAKAELFAEPDLALFAGNARFAAPSQTA
jgi:cytochrome b pre-mRNA-processing protein 3